MADNIDGKSVTKRNDITWTASFWIVAVVSVIVGGIFLDISQSAFNFDLYTQMSVEQRVLVTLGQTNGILLLIAGILGGIFFASAAIYTKINQK